MRLAGHETETDQQEQGVLPWTPMVVGSPS